MSFTASAHAKAIVLTRLAIEMTTAAGSGHPTSAATLVDLYALPFDEVAIVQLGQQNAGRVLTVEDNYGGGMGSAVADVLARHGGAYTLTQMYVRQIPKSVRTPDEVLRSLHLSVDDIVTTAIHTVEVAAK